MPPVQGHYTEGNTPERRGYAQMTIPEPTAEVERDAQLGQRISCNRRAD